MNVDAFVAAIFADQATNVVLALVVVLPIVDWITGSLRAIAGKTFELAAFDVFVRTQIAGRTIPLAILLLLGRAITVAVPETLEVPGFDVSILTGGGILAAVPFLLSSAKSIIDNANPSEPDRLPTVTET